MTSSLERHGKEEEKRLKKEPLLGAHTSIAGGLDKLVIRGRKLGCRTIQIFTKNSNQWKERYLDKEEIDLFKEARERSDVEPVIAHGSYLINLASPDDEIYDKSINAVLNEMERCEKLGIECLVLHPGSHRGSGEEEGIDRVVQAIDRIHRERSRYRVRITLETTAGQGATLGYKLEQIAQMMEGVRDNSRLALCLDTCHVFTAGYEMRDEKSYERLFNDVETLIGMEHLKVLHLNDSKRDCGSRIDRHEDVGKGLIGLEPFRWIMQDERLRDIPKILETPGIGTDKNREKGRYNLQLLRSFAG